MKIFLMCLFAANAAFSFSAESVYEKLLAANPNVPRLPIVVRSDIYDWCSLACTNGTRIYISTELLNLVKNEEELSAIIGHEMAHNMLSGESEMDADVIGLDYAVRAGYNKCKAARIMLNYAEDHNHPSGDKRYRNTGC